MSPAGPAEPAAVMLADSGPLRAERRLRIYRTGYRKRLLEAMGRLHPALRTLLGPELFDDFAADYLDARPSHCYTLAQLDEDFADHLAARRPDRNLPAAQRETWIDVLIDLARYERTFAEVCDGPGTEGEPVTTPDIPVVVAAPCLRLMWACAPVHRYHAAARRGRTPEPPIPAPTYLAISRCDYRVTATPLESAAYELLRALVAQTPIERAAASASMPLIEARAHRRRWIAAGWLRASRPEPDRRPRDHGDPALFGTPSPHEEVLR